MYINATPIFLYYRKSAYCKPSHRQVCILTKRTKLLLFNSPSLRAKMLILSSQITGWYISNISKGDIETRCGLRFEMCIFFLLSAVDIAHAIIADLTAVAFISSLHWWASSGNTKYRQLLFCISFSTK